MSETYEGFVEVILPGGEGIVRQPSGDVFISNVVAGDTVRYQVSQKKRGVLRGELLKVLTPSVQRVSPPCAVAEACGGCALQPINQKEQALLKTSWVTDAFKALITENTQVIPLQAQTTSFAGRRRVRWFTNNNKLGFRKRYSHGIVQTTECVALTQPLDALRQQLEQSLPSFPKYIESIQAVALSNGTHVIFESEQACPSDFTSPEIEGIQWWWRKLNTPSIKAINKPSVALFDNIQLAPFSKPPINIQIGPNDFIQGNQQGNQALIQQVLTWCEGSSRIVDLFSGCGNLSLPVASALGAKVMGAELNMSSVQAANNNAKRLGLDATYEVLDLFGAFNTEPFIAADTLILDPPRKGAKRICQMIQKFFPKQVIMVNCDVASGSRDAKALAQAGFKLKALRPLDLFPYTGHVEVLSLWTS